MIVRQVGSLAEFLESVDLDCSAWKVAWFRGEPETPTPLAPKLYRAKSDGSFHHENKLLQQFRLMARGLGPTPAREATDEWLFLARHTGLPTRVMDWSFGALIALYFALGCDTTPVVWALNPFHLNALSADEGQDQFPITWFQDASPGAPRNIGNQNFRAAWEASDVMATELPVAVMGPAVHERIRAQRGCFTIHGRLKDSASVIAGMSPALIKYKIAGDRSKMMAQLNRSGIDEFTVYPDFNGLTTALAKQY